MPKDEQQEIKLDYGGKVYASLFEVGRRAHVSFLWFLLLTIGLVLFSIGAIRVEQQVAVLGFLITGQAPKLLVFSAILLALTQLNLAAHGSEQWRLRTELEDTYASVGFAPQRKPFEDSWSAFLYPDGSGIMMSVIQRGIFAPWIVTPLLTAFPVLVKARKRPWGLVLRLVVFGLVFLLPLLALMLFLPIAAEYLAIRSAATIQNSMTGWLWLAIALLVIVNVGVALISWHSLSRSLRTTGLEIGELLLPILQDLERETTGNGRSQRTTRHSKQIVLRESAIRIGDSSCAIFDVLNLACAKCKLNGWSKLAVRRDFMARSIRVDTGILERYHAVSCAECGQQQDTDEGERADTIRVLKTKGRQLTERSWTCPACVASIQLDE
jgi:hypothetical protein